MNIRGKQVELRCRLSAFRSEMCPVSKRKVRILLIALFGFKIKFFFLSEKEQNGAPNVIKRGETEAVLW